MIKANNLCIFCKMEKKRGVSCSNQTSTYERFKEKKSKPNWIMFIAHLHQRLWLYTIGWMNLNVVVHIHMWCTSGSNWGCYGRIIDKVHDIVLPNRRVKVRELVEATGISHGTVISIARIIGYEKVIGKMPRLFTVDHKRDHVTISKQCLEMFQRNPDEFLRRFITVDKHGLLHTRDEGTVKIMNFTGWISSEEGEDRKVSRKGGGHSFLGCTRYNSYRLFRRSKWSMAITTQPY